ncbi:MAG: hypothetical protein KatS3mg113_1102 [Planctomycetaceae bacterium]|nr:MAG: hypothetical protein KatS3mg113_1102 [Planctomycetaceae bacterium]
MSLDRRDFHRWTLAAVGGWMAGTLGCSRSQPAAPEGATTTHTGAEVPPDIPPPAAGGEVALTEAEQILLAEPHVCRGLNTCKGLGRSKDNACAGQGTCASVTDHACAGQNECKGQGGCGENPGMNACKGQGGCHIPLMDDAWTKARAAFEQAMKKAGKTYGAAPAKG